MAGQFVISLGSGSLSGLMMVAAGAGVVVTVGSVVLVLAFVVQVALSGEPDVERAVRAAYGRYLRVDDLDEPSQVLLHRAQTAIAAVLGSTVNSEGLLDDVANAVTLPYQEWEIAQTLRTITELRAEYRSIPDDQVTGRVTAVLDEQRDALGLATMAVTERVVALEAYATCVRAADAARAERLILGELAGRDDAYRDLAARAAHDHVAAEEIADLTRHAHLVERSMGEWPT